MICLTVEYNDETFCEAVETLERKYKFFSDLEDTLYYNGILYKGFEFGDGNFFALAYHICAESNIISYIVFETPVLSYMDIEASLGCHANQVVPHVCTSKAKK